MMLSVSSISRLHSCHRILAVSILSVCFHTGYGLKADVWSFGVLLWEMVVPNPVANRFVGVPAVRYCRELAAGVRLELPAETDAEYIALVRQCWQWKPEDRPSAAELQAALASIMLRLEGDTAAALS
jgi:hypothetical protein